jgi:hypothetical protein
VSLKIPEPHTNTLGINKMAMAMGRVRFGYNEAKALNNDQIPVKEMKANSTEVGKYVFKVRILRKAVMDTTVYEAGSL